LNSHADIVDIPRTGSVSREMKTVNEYRCGDRDYSSKLWSDKFSGRGRMSLSRLKMVLTKRGVQGPDQE